MRFLVIGDCIERKLLFRVSRTSPQTHKQPAKAQLAIWLLLS